MTDAELAEIGAEIAPMPVGFSFSVGEDERGRQVLVVKGLPLLLAGVHVAVLNATIDGALLAELISAGLTSRA